MLRKLPVRTTSARLAFGQENEWQAEEKKINKQTKLDHEAVEKSLFENGPKKLHWFIYHGIDDIF